MNKISRNNNKKNSFGKDPTVVFEQERFDRIRVTFQTIYRQTTLSKGHFWVTIFWNMFIPEISYYAKFYFADKHFEIILSKPD